MIRSQTGLRQQPYIDIKRPFEVFSWSHKLGVSEEDLLRAIGAVGPTLEAVQRQLRRRH